MTEEDKNLLFIDISGRLPYGVKVEAETWLEDEGEFAYVPDKVYSINSDGYIVHGYGEVDIENTRPYLFPMTAMTEEQYNQYIKCSGVKAADWLNRNHFDYRGLIEKGLAIDATNLNIY